MSPARLVQTVISLLLVAEFVVAREPALFTSNELESATRVFRGTVPRISSYNSDPVIIAVKNSIKNTDQRKVIRETWAAESQVSHQSRVMFVMGYSSDLLLMSSIADEAAEFGDILMGNFEDDYYNLTLKTIFTLKWQHQHHLNKWLLYVDDDVIVNRDYLEYFVSLQLENKKQQSLPKGEVDADQAVMYCYALRNSLVIRDPDNKWYIDQNVYPNDRYPDYCTGFATLMPAAAVARLLRSCLHPGTEPRLWIDDVFVTGFAAQVANVSIISSPLFDPLYSSCSQSFHEMIAVGQWDPEQMRHMWPVLRSENLVTDMKSFLICLLSGRVSFLFLTLIAFNVAASCVLLAILLRYHLNCCRFFHRKYMYFPGHRDVRRFFR